MNGIIRVIPACLFILAALSSFAQDESEKKRPSPLAIAAIRYKDAYIKITYSQPQKRGREIFGGIVPYGRVWRTGANEATEITVTKNISINGFLLKAGTYSIFTIPEKGKWTIIINTELGLWGSYNYNSKLDLLRFVVPVQAIVGEVIEPLTIHFNQRNEAADLRIAWDNVSVMIPIKFLN